MKLCDNCSYKNLEGSTFCQECGQKLDSIKTSDDSHRRSSNSKTIIIVAVVLFVGFILLLILSNNSSSSSEGDTNLTGNTDVDTSSKSLPTFNSTHLYLEYYECTIYFSVCNVVLPVRGTTDIGAQVELLSPTYSLLAVTSGGEVRGDIPITLSLGTNTLKFQVTYSDGEQEIKYLDATLESK
ncbi:MAG TPA: hypothetical protein VIH52_00605 [Candidatus Nanoarchaeia archaeon]